MIEDISRLFKILSDPTRLRIVEILMEEDLCVCELMFFLKQEQSRVSHQLRRLREAKLVEKRKQGQWVIYNIPEDVQRTLKPLLGQYVKSENIRALKIHGRLANLKTKARKEIRKKELNNLKKVTEATNG